jgi:putative copper export protein
MAAVLLALAALLLARRAGAGPWRVVGVSAVAAAVGTALSGHAVAVDGRAALAVGVHTLHVLAAGGWLGTLLLVVVAGLWATRTLGPGERAPAAAALVNAFSPWALAFAATVAVTGAAAAWLHLAAPAALWSTTYGRTLLVKLAVLVPVAATGAYNWRRLRPSLHDEQGGARLTRSATVELAAAAVALAVTAVLVATPPDAIP